ncbi:hypothetical protein N2152v2_000557 [Parachlorella kessleri]
MKAVGICGSDIHYWKRGRIADFVVREPMVSSAATLCDWSPWQGRIADLVGRIADFVVREPMVIGHESAGTVAAVAEGVVGLAVGDRVALEPGVPCWSHPACRVGRYNLDPDIKFFATPPFHGSLAKFVDHPADWCYKLPENMSHEEGAMCEPLSVGIHACQRGGVGPGKRVAILGAGPIGLVALLAAKAFGADVVAICDLKPHNLQLAKQLGASYTHQSGIGELPQATAEALKQGAGVPGGFEVVIDCAGFEATMRAAIKACTSGGRIVLVGMGQEEMKLPVVEASIREVDIMGSFRYCNTRVDILGSFRYCNTYPLCIQLIASGRVDVKPLITHRFGFSQQAVLDGFGTAHRADETGAIKVMFNI